MQPQLAPNPSSLSSPFWEAAAKGILVRPLCNRCNKSFFTPQIACTHCLSEDWRWEPSGGEGVIDSAVVVHRPPQAGIPVPYVLASVLLDEGWTMLSNVVHCDPHEATIGRRVRVVFDQRAGDQVIPCFELIPREGTRA
jgi:uncharacterized protein